MDKEIIFFIIFVVFSILSSLLNKKKKQPEAQEPEGDTPHRPQRKRKPFSFEDILREFEAEVTEQQKPRPQKEIVMAEEEEDDYEYQTRPRETYAKTVDEVRKKDAVYEDYENARPLEDKLKKISREVKEIGVDEEEEPAPAPKLNDYAEALNDAEGLRKAIVLKEILDRKHF